MVTARLLARRWALYLATFAAVLGLEALFYTFAHAKFPSFADFYAELVGTPLAIAVVNVFIGADATNSMTVRERWERISERAWAIVVFDVGLSLVQTSGIATLFSGRDAGNALMGLATLLLSAMLVYAEPFIALEAQAQTLTLLPFAILRSMMLGWVNISRIFSLFSVQLAQAMAAILVHQAAAKLGMNTLWIDMTFGALTAIPLAALFTVAYLDTLSQERATAP